MVTAGWAPYLGGAEWRPADQAAGGALFLGVIPGQPAVEADVVEKFARAVGHVGHIAQIDRAAVPGADHQVLQVLRIRDELAGLDPHVPVVAVEGPREHAGVRGLDGAAQIQRRNAVRRHPAADGRISSSRGRPPTT